MPEGPLKIFSDRTLLAPGERHEIILYPFWGKCPEDPNDPTTGRFDTFQQVGRQFLAMTDLRQCDIAVLPYQWKGLDRDSSRFIAAAKEAGKPVVIFFNHDDTEEIPLKDGFIFRTSFFRSKRRVNEFAMPGWSEDFSERYFKGRVPIREKSTLPVVGYCGYAGNWRCGLKKLLGRPLHPGRRLRTQALDVLRRSNLLATNLLIRREFWAGVYKPGRAIDPVEIRKVRREFVDSIAASDYVLCTRGAGNFSYRLYETLSLGRIPVFVDTDCPLPAEQFIDWKSICVWVDHSEVDCIDRKVAEFHGRLSPEEFRTRQQRCRSIWEEWISPVGFFKNLGRIICL